MITMSLSLKDSHTGKGMILSSSKNKYKMLLNIILRGNVAQRLRDSIETGRRSLLKCVQSAESCRLSDLRIEKSQNEQPVRKRAVKRSE
jgi:hypothetical protein